MNRLYSAQEQRNREIVIDYYTKLICNWDFTAASTHLGEHFIQHNPAIPDGVAGVKSFADNAPQFIKDNLKTTIRRVLVDGDFVVVHTMNTLPGTNGRAIADFFRLENGKVVEHWDVLQDVPEHSLHTNPIV